MNKRYEKAINVLSKFDIDLINNYKKYRKIVDVASIKGKVSTTSYIDVNLYLDDEQVKVRIFIPENYKNKLILYFHGGGWVTGNIETHTNLCSNLAKKTKQIVVSVEYPLAPEYPYPYALNTCYKVAKYFYNSDNILDVKSNDITLMGDSAGANLVLATVLKSRTENEFTISKQILVYPAVYYDHSSNSPFTSVKTKGTDWGLTSKKVEEYMTLYVPNFKDRFSPYVSPILSNDFTNMPKTLMITAENDPLRDEGEIYAYLLKKCHNDVSFLRVDAIHGFLSLPFNSEAVTKSFNKIVEFMEDNDE